MPKNMLTNGGGGSSSPIFPTMNGKAVYYVEVVHYDRRIEKVSQHSSQESAIKRRAEVLQSIEQEWKNIIHNKSQLPFVQIVKYSQESVVQ
jgi:hypothetical protein